MQFTYTATVTNKLLIEAAFSQFFSNWGGQTPTGALDPPPFVPVMAQRSGGTPDGVQGMPVTNMVYQGSPASTTTTRHTTSGVRQLSYVPVPTA